LLQQHHGEFISFELGVEFFAKIDGMTGVAKANLFVLGAWILHQHVAGFEIDGLTVEKHCIYTRGIQDLIHTISDFIGQFSKYLGAWSAHHQTPALIYVKM
jgi:hypothetical protein